MKKILIFLIIGMFLISSVSALDFDNVKSYEKNLKKITITNAFGLGDDLAEYTLTANSDYCLIDCYAEGTATIYSKDKLFSELNFRNGFVKSSKILIEGEEKYNITLYDYSNNVLPNGSIEKNIVGTHQEERTKKVWLEYDGKKLDEGFYRWRIEGNKVRHTKDDWIASAFGEVFDEWAWWDTGYDYKRNITGLNVSIPLAINGTSYTNLEGTDTMIYGICNGDGCAVYYNDSSINAIANDTDEFWKVRTLPTISQTGTRPDNLTGYLQFDNSESGKAINFAGANFTYSKGVTQGNSYIGDIGNSFKLGDTDLNISGTGHGFTGEKGSVVMTAQFTFDCENNADNYILDAGAGSYSIATATGGTLFQFRVGGGVWASADCTGLWDAGDKGTITATWDTIADEYYLYYNGSLFASDLVTDKTAGSPSNLNIFSQLDTQDTNGNITRLEFYDRVLTAQEVKEIYDIDTSLSQKELQGSPPTIILNTPTNKTNSTSNSITFNCSGNEPTELYNVSLIINGSIEYTESNTGVTNISLERVVNLGDGVYNWTCKATDAENEATTAEGFVLGVDLRNPLTNVTYPQESVGFQKLNNNLTITWDITDTNLAECKGSFDNWTSNFSLNCADSNITINITSLNNNSFYIWANDSFSRSSFNYSIWAYSLIEGFNVYNSSTYETARETITINVSHDGTETLNSVFYYDGVNRGVASKIEYALNTVFSKSFDVSTTNGTENKTFYFTITKGSSKINTTKINQSVIPIQLALCNASVSNHSLNFTLFDEETGIVINSTETPTSYLASFNYWAGFGSQYKNYSFSILTNETIENYSICIDPNMIIKTNLSSLYSASGYSERAYNLANASLTNATSHIPLYLLNDSSSVKFTTSVKNGITELPNANVIISKFFTGEGVYKTISIRTTDNLGQFIEYLDLDKDYKYSIIVGGVLLGVIDQRATCDTAPCEQTLQLSGTQGNIWNAYNNTYATNVVSNLSFNRSTSMVDYTFVDITGLANYFRLEVYQVRYNQTQNIICNNYSYASAGTLYCNLTGFDGDFLAKTYISRSPEKVDKVLAILINNIVEELGMLGVFFSIIVIITLVVVGAIVSQGNPSVMIAFFGLAVLGLKLMMVFPFSWVVVSLIEMLVIFIIAKLKT